MPTAPAPVGFAGAAPGGTVAPCSQTIKFKEANLINYANYAFKSKKDTIVKEGVILNGKIYIRSSQQIDVNKYIRFSNIIITSPGSYPSKLNGIITDVKSSNNDFIGFIRKDKKGFTTYKEPNYIPSSVISLNTTNISINSTIPEKEISYSFKENSFVKTKIGINPSVKNKKLNYWDFSFDPSDDKPLYILDNNVYTEEELELEFCAPGPGASKSAPGAPIVAPPPKPILPDIPAFKVLAVDTTDTLQVGLAVQFLYSLEAFKNVILRYGFQQTDKVELVCYYIREIFTEIDSKKIFKENYLVNIYNALPDDIKGEKSTSIVKYILGNLLDNFKFPIFNTQLKSLISFKQIQETICVNKTSNSPINPFILNIVVDEPDNGETTVYKNYLDSITSTPFNPSLSRKLDFYINALNYQQVNDITCIDGKKLYLNIFEYNNDYLLINFENKFYTSLNIESIMELNLGINDKYKLNSIVDKTILYYTNGTKGLYKIDNTNSTNVSVTTFPINFNLAKDERVFFLYKKAEPEKIVLEEKELNFSDYSKDNITCELGIGKCIEFNRKNINILIKILDGDRTFYQHMLSLNISKEFIEGTSSGKDGGGGKGKPSQLTDDLQMSTIIEYYRFCNQNDKIQKSAFFQVIRYFIENPVGKWIDPEKFFELIVLSYIQVKGFSKTKYEKLLAIKDEDFVRLLLFVGRFLPDKNFYIYYKPFGGKIHYINYLYQILRNPINKACALSDSFFIFLLLGFKILGADFRLPVNQNVGYQSYYEDVFNNIPDKRNIIRSVYERCIFDEDQLLKETNSLSINKVVKECLNSIIKNNESKFIDFFEKIYKDIFISVVTALFDPEYNGDNMYKYENVETELIDGSVYKLKKIPSITDGESITKGDAFIHWAFLNKYMGLLTDNSVYAFKYSFTEKSYDTLLNSQTGKKFLIMLPNNDYLMKTPSLSEVIEFNSSDCMKYTIRMENSTKVFDKYENVDLNTCIENASFEAFGMLLEKGFYPTYFTINKIIYLINIYKDYPIIANNNYLSMLVASTNKCIRVDKFQERILASMANATLFKPSKKSARVPTEAEDTEVYKSSYDNSGNIKLDQNKQQSSYFIEFLTLFRNYKLTDKICSIKSEEIPRSIKNLLFSINIDITKNVQQICEDLKILLETTKGSGKRKEATDEEGRSGQQQQGGGPERYFKDITKIYVAQLTGLGMKDVDNSSNYNSKEYEKIKGKDGKSLNPFLFNPKCLVVYMGALPKSQSKEKRRDERSEESEDGSKPKQSNQPRSMIYIYAPPIFNKILTTHKNEDGTEVPENVLNSIKNNISNLSKMGISPEKIIQFTDAYKKFNDADEITNEDTNYHYLTIIRLLQMYGLDIKLLTQISTNKMVQILKKYMLIESSSDEYFFRNLDRSPMNLKVIKPSDDFTIEDELNQQIATFSTYMFYLINSSNKFIPDIMNMLQDSRY
jgi:hypothetical protein